MEFTPDYKKIRNAAYNIEADRMPLYEHHIDICHMERILNKQFSELIQGDDLDKIEYFDNLCTFYKTMGYDIITHEVPVRSFFPGGGALDSQITPAIQTREDFNNYPWDEIPIAFQKEADKRFSAIRKALHPGMKLIGGPGYGVFECVQDLAGFMNLSIMAFEDPQLYKDMFLNMRKLYVTIWSWFMENYSDIVCIARMGDDLGFKSNTMLSPEDIIEHIVPAYADIVAVVHSHNHPFLLHSCGKIFNVMDALIDTAKINAKHSNEDQIAPFSVWVEEYGDRIGNFGGVDADVLCRFDKKQLEEYIAELLPHMQGAGGVAFGTGNSVPDYVPTQSFIDMTQIVREYRNNK